jgi:DNA-binding NarL/FixJ family response regulator
MNGYVTKPFKPDDLFNAIRQALKGRTVPNPKSPAAKEFKQVAEMTYCI